MNVKLRRLWIQVSSDRKRFSLLCAVVLVGLLLWTRIIVVSNLPRTAVADDPAAGAPGGADKAAPGSARKSSRDKSVSTGRGGAKRPIIKVELATAPARDPFVISTAHFPKSTALVEMEQQAPKSGAATAEDAQQVQARRLTHLRGLVERLKLEAAMPTGTGIAMAVISGKSYRQDEWISPAPGAASGDGSELVKFQLVEVRHRSVILQWEDHRFELKMATP
jgi:hypothetical protein